MLLYAPRGPDAPEAHRETHEASLRRLLRRRARSRPDTAELREWELRQLAAALALDRREDGLGRALTLLEQSTGGRSLRRLVTQALPRERLRDAALVSYARFARQAGVAAAARQDVRAERQARRLRGVATKAVRRAREAAEEGQADALLEGAARALEAAGAKGVGRAAKAVAAAAADDEDEGED